MAEYKSWQGIPTKLALEQFKEFVLTNLHTGSCELQPKLPLHKIFHYILKQLCLGCQGKELPIEQDRVRRLETPYTRLYLSFRRFEAQGL